MKKNSKSTFQEVFKDIHITRRKMNIHQNIKTSSNFITKNKELIDNITASDYIKFINKLREEYSNKKKEREKFYKNMNTIKEKYRKERLKKFHSEMINNVPSYLVDMGIVDFYKLNVYKNNLINKKNKSRPATAKTASTRYMTEYNTSKKYKLKSPNNNMEKSNKNDNINSNVCQTEYTDTGIDFDLISGYAFERKKIENKMNQFNRNKNSKSYSNIVKTKLSRFLLKNYSAKNLSFVFNKEITLKTNPNIDNSNNSKHKNRKYQSNRAIFIKSKINNEEPIFQTAFPLENSPFNKRPKISITNTNSEPNQKLIKDRFLIRDIQNCEYVPLKNKYKEINFHKNCIFNNEFLPPKKKKSKLKTTKCLKIRKNDLIKKNQINEASEIPKKANCHEEKKIIDETNKILKNLNEIGTVMTMDKNYIDTSINKASLKRKKMLNQEDLFMKNEVVKNIKFDYFLKNKERINREKRNVFNDLKKCLCEVRKTSVKSPFINGIIESLGKYCKQEKKDKIVKKQVLDQHYIFRREENREIHNEMRGIIKSMEKKLNIMSYLGDQIENEIRKNKKHNINKKKRPKSANVYLKRS